MTLGEVRESDCDRRETYDDWWGESRHATDEELNLHYQGIDPASIGMTPTPAKGSKDRQDPPRGEGRSARSVEKQVQCMARFEKSRLPSERSEAAWEICRG